MIQGGKKNKTYKQQGGKKNKTRKQQGGNIVTLAKNSYYQNKEENNKKKCDGLLDTLVPDLKKFKDLNKAFAETIEKIKELNQKKPTRGDNIDDWRKKKAELNNEQLKSEEILEKKTDISKRLEEQLGLFSDEDFVKL